MQYVPDQTIKPLELKTPTMDQIWGCWQVSVWTKGLRSRKNC